MQAFGCLEWCVDYAPYMAVLSPVAVLAVVRCRGYVKISPEVAVQTPWDIARCMLMVVHVRATPKSNSVDNVWALQGDATVLEKVIKL